MDSCQAKIRLAMVVFKQNSKEANKMCEHGDNGTGECSKEEWDRAMGVDVERTSQREERLHRD